MKMFKKKDGFTLVELIVVIAILAILAGVAIPAYSGYIEKAQDAAVITELDAIQTAAQGANAKAGEITKIQVTDKSTVVITGEGLSDKFVEDFKLFYKDGAGLKTSGEAINDGNATLTIPEINNWDKSSYAEAPTGKSAGATWESGKWTNGVA